MSITSPGRSSAPADRRQASAFRRAVGQVAPLLFAPRPGHVCFASVPDFTDSAYWLYRHLLTSRTGLRITWLLHDADRADHVEADFRESGRSEHHELQVLPWQSRAAYRSFLNSSAVFHTHGLFNFSRSRRERRVVSLWHGMPIKAVGALDDSGLWANDVTGDVHVATSRMFRPIVAAAFGVEPRSVLTSGLPRSDVLKGLIPPSHGRAAIAETLGLDPVRPVVVWLPTHRRDADSETPRSFLDQVDTRLLETLIDSCMAQGSQLVAKLHHLDALNDGDTERLTSGRALTLVSAEEWDRSGLQVYDLLAAADGLITDVSSVLIDFLHTGRPIGIFGFDEATYERNIVLPVDHLSTSAAIFAIQDASSVASFVDRVSDPEPIDLPSDDVAHWLNEDVGVHSSERISLEVGL